MFFFSFDDHTSVLVTLPKYLFETRFKNPTNPHNAPYQYAFRTQLPFFEHIRQFPERLRVFNSAMTVQRAGRGEDWFKFFPVESTISKNFPSDDKDAVLLVDVGGGVGHDLKAFKARFPELPGRLVLQDLPQVIENIATIPDGIEPLKHDMFTPQPIQNARAYYLRTVLHDWPDSYCRDILKNITSAMGVTSRLLLNECVLAETGNPLFPAQLDISMMMHYGSMERSRNQWESLLEGVGLEIVKVHAAREARPGSESLIEAMKKV